MCVRMGDLAGTAVSLAFPGTLRVFAVCACVVCALVVWASLLLSSLSVCYSKCFSGSEVWVSMLLCSRLVALYHNQFVAGHCESIGLRLCHGCVIMTCES